MKKMLTMLFFWIFSAHICLAESNLYFPDEIFVQEHWISMTKSYDIETRTHKLGTLYRRFFSLFLTYDFYNPDNTHTLSAKLRFFSFGADLDLYEPNGRCLGSIEEKIFKFFPTFEIYAPNLSTKLARAEMNFWGTKFYIYDPVSDKEMAIMSRPFFRLKNDWSIHVTDRSLLERKNIDSRVLMTVLAIQGEIEDWQKEVRNRDRDQDKNFLKAMQLPNELALLRQDKANITQASHESELEALANELDQSFIAANPNTAAQNNSERIYAFAAFCQDLLNSPSVSPQKKAAIQTLLNLRLN
jgi:hypothetical protein